jgi:large subunit ribosomal protein L10
MSKRVKEMLIAEIRTRVGDNRDLLLIDSSRLDAVTANKFRLALRAKEIGALTVQNTLARRALGEFGIKFSDDLLQGPTTLVWGGEDIVALSKEIAKWAKDLEPLQIKGAVVEGSSLNASQVDALSKSPGRLELISQIAGLALSPGRHLAAAILGPGGKLAGQVQAIADKAEGA